MERTATQFAPASPFGVATAALVADAEVATKRTIGAITNSDQASKEALQAIIQALIDRVRANPTIPAAEREALVDTLYNAMGSGDTGAMSTALQNARVLAGIAIAEEEAEKTRGTSAVATRALDAQAWARINYITSRTWNLDDDKQLVAFVEIMADEPDPQFAAFVGEQVVAAAKEDPELMRSAKSFAAQPKRIQKQVLADAAEAKQQAEDLLKKDPNNKTLQTIISQKLYTDTRVQEALDDFEKDGDTAKLDAATQPAQDKTESALEKRLTRVESSEKPEDKWLSDTAEAMGGPKGVMRRFNGMSEARRERAKAYKGPLDGSSEAQDAATVRLVSPAVAERSIMDAAFAAQALKAREQGTDIKNVIYMLDDPAVSMDRKIAAIESYMKDDPRIAAVMKEKTPEERQKIYAAYIREVSTNEHDTAGGVRQLSKGFAGVLVRAKAEELGVKLDGSDKLAVAGMMASEGFQSFLKANKAEQEFWTDMAVSAVERNAGKDAANTARTLIQSAGAVAGGVRDLPKNAANLVSNTGKAATGFATDAMAVADMRYNDDIKKQLGTLQEKGWGDFYTTGKDGQKKNLFDIDGDGKLELDEIKITLARSGVKLDAFDADKDGDINGKELTNAMTAAVKKQNAALERSR